jgi:plastocyanin
MRAQMFLFVVVLGLADLAAPKDARAATIINVTNQGATAYLFNGGPANQTLTLERGTTYNFVVNATGHPFNITSVPGLPVQDLVDSGLSNNGTASGTVVFTPSASTPASFSYQCGVHTAMTGTINLIAASTVPAVGGWLLLAVGLLFAVAGTALVRQRRRS